MEGANQPHAVLQSDFRHCSEVVEQDCGLPFEEGGYYGHFGGGAFPVGIFPWSITLAVPAGRSTRLAVEVV